MGFGYQATSQKGQAAMRWHLIEGAGGCDYAVQQKCVAVVVDALRASTTAALLIDAGALDIVVVREVEDAWAARRDLPDALLYGERGGLPPDGFDYGNSPLTVAPARGRRVIFTTTTGAGRLVAAWGAAAVYMGAAVNASAVGQAAASHGEDVVLIPAGLAGDPAWDAQEDWAAATAIAWRGGGEIGEGAERFQEYRRRLERDGLLRLLETAPHADKLRRIGLGAEVGYCAQVDITAAVPMAVARVEHGVVLHRWRGGE